MTNEQDRIDMVYELFFYHEPTKEQLTKIDDLRQKAVFFALEIDKHCPPSADRTAAMRLLKEALMTATSSIILEGKGYK